MFMLSFLATIGIGQNSSKFDDELKHQLTARPSAGERFRVIIYMNEEYDQAAMSRQLLYLRGEERRTFVINELQQFARNSQSDLLQMLEDGNRGGLVTDVNPFWIVNGVGCTVDRTMLDAISQRSDVALIESDELRNMLPGGETRQEPAKSEVIGTGQSNASSRGLAWHVPQVHANEVWTDGSGYNGSGVVVAILDTGVNYNHNDIKNHMWDGGSSYPNHGYDYVNNDNNPMDDHGHGSHCAGIVAGDGTSGTQTGIAPGATIMAIKVLSATGSGSNTGINNGMQFAVDHGADIVSMSLGTAGGSASASDRQRFVNMLNAGIIASIAAGNEGEVYSNAYTQPVGYACPVPRNVGSPGNCPPPWANPDQTLTGGASAVVCIGASGRNDQKTTFSSFGPNTWSGTSYNDYPYTSGSTTNIGLIRPDIIAPGADIISMDYSNVSGYVSMAGTSMATPCAAGIMALMLSADPTLTPARIDELLETTAFPVEGRVTKNNFTGAGRADAKAAIDGIFSSAARPTGLNFTTCGGNVSLTWDAVSAPSGYCIYRDNVQIASGVMENSYTDVNAGSGQHVYYVRADDGSHQSVRSKAIVCTIEPYASIPANFNATLTDTQVDMSWDASTVSNTLASATLGFVSSPYTAYGGGSGNVFFGVRYTPEDLREFKGMSIDNVSIPINAAGNYTLRIYRGTTNGNTTGTPAYTQTFNGTVGSWSNFTLTTPYAIDDVSQDLWVTFSFNATSTAYPAVVGIYNGPSSNCFYMGLTTNANSMIWESVPDFGPDEDGNNYALCIQTHLTRTTEYTPVYEVYRNDNVIAADLTSLAYSDATPAVGLNHYYVTSKVESNESCPSDAKDFDLTGYEITVTANPVLGGTVTGTGSYVSGFIATLSATASRGYEFTNWTKDGQEVSTENPYSFAVESAGAYVGNFEALTLHNITFNPSEQGNPEANPASAYRGETVTLIAHPNASFALSSWTVVDSYMNEIPVTDNQFVMPDSDVTITATYEFAPYHDITLACVLNGSISASATQAEFGAVITLTATPDSGHSFGAWSVYKTDDLSVTIPVTDNQFVMPEYAVTVSASFTSSDNVTVSIGTSTSTNSNIPIRASNKYSLSQQIYTATEIGGAGTINSISFYSGSTSFTRSLVVYLNHTTKSSFTTSGTSSSNDWQQVSSDDIYFSGSVTTVRNGWTVITFTKPFVYDGTSNLLLTIDDNSNATATGKSFRASSTTNYVALYYGSTTDLNPEDVITTNATGVLKNHSNIQLGMTRENSKSLAVSPCSLSGFTYAEGRGPSAAQSFSVFGTSLTANVTVTASEQYEVCASEDGEYANSISLSLSSGKVDAMVFVRLKEGYMEGEYNGSLTVASGNLSQTVELEGNVTRGTYYTIVVTADPANAGTVTGGGSYLENTMATVTADADRAHIFSNWAENGAIVSTDTDYEFQVTGSRALVAHFDALTLRNLTYAEVENGFISGPANAYYGETITLEATPSSDYLFETWSVCKTGNPDITIAVVNNQFVMPDYDVTISASFVYNPEYDITVACGIRHGSVSVSATSALAGTTVNMTATPASEDYVFQSWVVFKSDDANTLVFVNDNSFTMPAYDVTVSAVFALDVEDYFQYPVGTEGSLSTNPNPNIPTKVNSRYSLSQCIYTPTQLGFSGKILGIAYNNYSNTSANRNVDLYLSTTDASSFSSNTGWITQTADDKVFSGTFAISGKGWQLIVFDEAFEYDGISKLLVTMDDNSGATGSTTSFYAFTGSNNNTIYNSGSTNLNPTSTITASGTRNNALPVAIFLVENENEYDSDEAVAYAPCSVEGLDYMLGFGPSDAKPVQLIASHTTIPIAVSAPEHYEISQNPDGPYTSSITLASPWLKYDNGTYATNVGASGTLYWGSMFPSSILSAGYAGGTLTKVAMYANESTTGTYTLNIYQGGDTAPQTLVCTQDFTPGTDEGFVEVALNQPLAIDATKNLWITFYQNGTDYPAAACIDNGTANNRWISIDGSEWIDMNTTSLSGHGWMIRGYVDMAAKGGQLVELPAFHGNVGGELTMKTVDGKNRSSELFYGFEDGTTQGWTSVDNDHDGYGWILETSATTPHMTPYEGNGCMYSESYDNDSGTPLTPDNWLISPKVTLGGSMSFYAVGQDANYAAEHFAVYVSTTGNAVADFTVQVLSETIATGTYTMYSVDLTQFSGEGYVAIRHYNITDMFCLNVDNITISTEAPTPTIPSYVELSTVYVRLKAGLPIGEYNNEEMAVVSGEANSTVFLNGQVSEVKNIFFTDGDWDNATNWSFGFVPEDGSDVVIEANAVIPAGYVANVNEVIINEGGTLTIADGGQLIHNNEGVQATVRKMITGYEADKDYWYLIGSPVTDNNFVTHLVSNQYDLYTFDQTEVLEWRNQHQNATIEHKTGYLYANSEDVTLEFKGTVAASAAPTPLAYNEGYALTGFNLIGNPYPCNAYISNSYLRMNADGTAFEAGSGAIAPCEAVFVEASAEGQSVEFGKTATRVNAINVSIARNRGAAIDKAIIRFDGKGNLHKLTLGESSAKLYIPQYGEEFAAISSQGNEGEIPVNFKAMQNGTYTINVNIENVDAEYLHLIDNLTGADVDVLDASKGSASYTFNAKVSDYASRFKLVFSMTGLDENASTSSTGDFAYISNGNLIIENIEGQAVMQIVDVLGRIISREIVSGSYNKALNLRAGLYTINLNGVTQKIVVKRGVRN